MIYIFLLVGLAMILIGANFLTDAASAVATRFRISQLVIGLTIVAFGTSAPELVVSVTSAVKGISDMSIGNVVGSNLFNTTMIVGVTAMVAPITVQRNTVRAEIPLCILASCVLLFLSMDVWALLPVSAPNMLSRTDGFILLSFLAIFMSYTFSIARENTDTSVKGFTQKIHPIWKDIVLLVLGFALLIYGGDLFVNNASKIARSWGVSDAMIGLTLVAVGTSLPELATSVVAALKKNPELAIGNAIGSNLMNIFLVLGVSASVKPLSLGKIESVDLWYLICVSFVLFFVSFILGHRRILRREGALLVLLYLGYIVYKIARI
ncbi:MAG TPA: calcium/sodium antiporter [Bacteroidaceae bacterium]|nr:calcium/sodium antiporter [Bacteroidaceae bacterium]